MITVTREGEVYRTDNQAKYYQKISSDGYAYIYVQREKTYIHRLVAQAFVENPDPLNYTVVDHIDGDRLNNRASNLRWVTRAQNSKMQKAHRDPAKQQQKFEETFLLYAREKDAEKKEALKRDALYQANSRRPNKNPDKDE